MCHAFKTQKRVNLGATVRLLHYDLGIGSKHGNNYSAHKVRLDASDLARPRRIYYLEHRALVACYVWVMLVFFLFPLMAFGMLKGYKH